MIQANYIPNTYIQRFASSRHKNRPKRTKEVLGIGRKRSADSCTYKMIKDSNKGEIKKRKRYTEDNRTDAKYVKDSPHQMITVFGKAHQSIIGPFRVASIGHFRPHLEKWDSLIIS